MPFIIDDIAASSAAVSAISAGATAVWKQIGSLFRGSPPVEWPQANTLAEPTAKTLVANLVSTLGPSKIPAVFHSYVAKLEGYIRSSPHNPNNRDATIRALELEAVGQGGGFRVDGFPFEEAIQVQLAWAIWLHAHWLYGGVSQDEVGNGNALKKFQDSLVPTLIAAVKETTGEEVTRTGTSTTPQATNMFTVNAAKLFSSPVAAIAIAGVLVFALVKWGGRK